MATHLPAWLDVGSYASDLREERLRNEVTVYCTEFSKCGDYLVCGTSTGKLLVYEVAPCLEPEWWVEDGGARQRPRPALSISAHMGAVFSVQFSPDGQQLVSGADSETRVWAWAAMLDALRSGTGHVSPASTLEAPRATLYRGALGPLAETNSVCIPKEDPSLLYTACGDNNAYIWDMATEQIVRTLSGHSAYLHAVTAGARGQIITGSEDTTVRLWDARDATCSGVLTPCEDVQRLSSFQRNPLAYGKSHKSSSEKSGKDANRSTTSGKSGSTSSSKNKKIVRSDWIGALAVDNDANWLAAGGGHGTLYLYHLASRMVSSAMQCRGPLQVALFNQPDDTILCAGISPIVYHWKKDGTVAQQSDTSSPSVFSVNINECGNNRVLAASGAGGSVDIFINFANRAFSYSV